jgi:hypothetical protein
VRETVSIPDPQVFKFDLDKMLPSQAGRIEEEQGIVYKLILADKAKIKRLSNYAYDQSATKLDAIMAQRSNNNLPVRITVYEDYAPGSIRALAVYSFSAKEKYVEDITDLNKSGLIYDIKPDYAVKYTPK